MKVALAFALNCHGLLRKKTRKYASEEKLPMSSVFLLCILAGTNKEMSRFFSTTKKLLGFHSNLSLDYSENALSAEYVLCSE